MLNAFFTSAYTDIAECNTRRCSLILAIFKCGDPKPVLFQTGTSLPILYIYEPQPTPVGYIILMNA